MGVVLTVPKAVVDNQYVAFPKGTFSGEFNRVEDNERGTAGGDDWRFSLRGMFRNLTPMDEETPEVGARPFRADMTIIWDNQSLVELVNSESIGDLPFQLSRGLGSLSQLAVAVGAAARDEKGNVSFDLETFIQDLRENKYNERPVIIEVGHYTTKADPDTPRDQLTAVLAPESVTA